MYATKIQLKKTASATDELQAIDQVYVVGNVYFKTGWYKTDFLHDYLKANPDSIQVNLNPFPAMSPAIAGMNQKIIRSAPDKNSRDILLSLPRE